MKRFQVLLFGIDDELGSKVGGQVGYQALEHELVPLFSFEDVLFPDQKVLEDTLLPLTRLGGFEVLGLQPGG